MAMSRGRRRLETSRRVEVDGERVGGGGVEDEGADATEAGEGREAREAEAREAEEVGGMEE
jgi:hypothetical protein